MPNPRTNILDFSKEVKSMIDLQQGYFAARKSGSLNANDLLSKARKQEKYIGGLITSIARDVAELHQADLFSGKVTKHFDERLVSGLEMVKLYGEKVEFEWLNNEGTAWVKTGGVVSAVSIRHAELGRIRSLVVSGQKSVIGKEAING